MIRTLSARLTLWFLALFAALSLLAYFFTYVNLTATLNEKVDERLTQDVFEIGETLRTEGLEEAKREINLEAESDGVGRLFILFFSPDGTLLASSDLNAWPDLSHLIGMPQSEVAYQTLTLPGMNHQTRVLTQPLENGCSLRIGYLLEDDERVLEDFREVFGTAFAIILLVGAVAGFLVSKRALRGVDRIRQTTNRISQGDFSQRVPPGNDGEEIENLVRAFNQMQDKIQTLINELGDVTNNIAHDLRSPLTRIRGLAETTLTGSQNLPEYQDMAGAVIEECDRMVSMVNTMLEIAETDAGLRKIPDQAVDMADIAHNVGELFSTVAEDKDLNMMVAAEGSHLMVRGDRSRLQRAVANLLDNAIKYTPCGGTITIRTNSEADRVQILISDTGIGIPKEELAHVFDRFYRLDQSRSTPGSGLGLSLVQAVVRAHGGEIRVESTVGAGSVFIISLPKLPA